MEPFLIQFDKSIFESSVAAKNEEKERIEKAINAFAEAGFGTFQNEDLTRLFFSTEKYLFEKFMEGRPLEVAGMKLNKQKMFDLLDKPASYYNIISLVDEAKKYIGYTLKFSHSQLTPEQYIKSNFEFVPGKQLKLKIRDSVVEDLEASNKKHITTEKGMQLYNFAKGFCELVEKHNIIHKDMNRNTFVDQMLFRLIQFDFHNEKVHVNLDQVLILDQQA